MCVTCFVKDLHKGHDWKVFIHIVIHVLFVYINYTYIVILYILFMFFVLMFMFLSLFNYGAVSGVGGAGMWASCSGRAYFLVSWNRIPLPPFPRLSTPTHAHTHAAHAQMYLSAAGGCCDCGDAASWRQETFCPRHR
jgi:hypothetical protein